MSNDSCLVRRGARHTCSSTLSIAILRGIRLVLLGVGCPTSVLLQYPMRGTPADKNWSKSASSAKLPNTKKMASELLKTKYIKTKKMASKLLKTKKKNVAECNRNRAETPTRPRITNSKAHNQSKAPVRIEYPCKSNEFLPSHNPQ